MNQTINNPLLECMTQIFERKDKLFKQVDELNHLLPQLETVKNFFDVDEKVATVLSVIICDQLMGDANSIKRIMKNLGFTPIDHIHIANNIKELKKKGWVKLSKRRNYGGDELSVSKEVIDAIMHNDKSKLDTPLPANLTEALIATRTFIKEIINEFDKYEILEGILTYVEKYDKYSFFDDLLHSDNKLTAMELVVVIWLSCEYLYDKEEFDFDNIIELFAEDPSSGYNFKQRIKNNKSVLFTDEYVKFNNKALGDFSNVSLGDKVISAINKECTKVSTKKFSSKYCQVIEPSSITEQALYFNKSNQEAIDTILELTSENHYNQLKDRFNEHGMNAGLTMLFHGGPGTGKTELAKQLAKKNNRTLLLVDISSVKSMWVGESEKNIKKVFSDYKQALDYYEQTPILFFNEADAVIGKRKNVESSVDQMLNAMQNIILQELEDFKGIFIATTNLIHNLDNAIDRRILYKLKFENPDQETRFQILSSQFPSIDAQIINQVAENHVLSGGQIQNIKKKYLVNSVLFNNQNKEEEFQKYIAEETNFRTISRNSIGFKKTA